MDQGLAQGSLEYVAKVLVFVVNLEPKTGEVVIKTRSFNKEGFAGKITSLAGECCDKIRRRPGVYSGNLAAHPTTV